MSYRYTLADGPDELELARGVRIAVFVEEQGIPRHLELDDIDARADHVLVWHGDEPVATGRLYASEGLGIIARIAVLPAHRGQRLGARVVIMLEDIARQRDLPAVELSPHEHLEKFYRRLGYYRVPGEEEIAGHKLIRMRKDLGRRSPR